MAESTQRDFLLWALRGDESAVDFCETLGYVSQVWDDIHDEPSVDRWRVDNAFYHAMMVIPNHPFYVAHKEALEALLELTMLDYMTSNAFEHGSEHEKTLAFVLRDSLTAVVVYCARLVGGFGHAAEVAADVRAYFHNETLPEYLEGLKP